MDVDRSVDGLLGLGLAPLVGRKNPSPLSQLLLLPEDSGDSNPRSPTRRSSLGSSTMSRTSKLGTLVLAAAQPERRELAAVSEKERMTMKRSNESSTPEFPEEEEVIPREVWEKSEDLLAFSSKEDAEIWEKPEVMEISEDEMETKEFPKSWSPRSPTQRSSLSWDWEPWDAGGQDAGGQDARQVSMLQGEISNSPLRKLVSQNWARLQAALPPMPVLSMPAFWGKGDSNRKDLPEVKKRSWKTTRRAACRVMLRNKFTKQKGGIENFFDANSSKASKNSRRVTVQKLLELSTAEVVLNVEKIKMLATAFKEAGYKSGSVYLAEAKLMHVEAGGDWTAQLDRVFKQSKRALDRGRGPKSKAPEVPVQVRQEANYEKKVYKSVVLFPRELFQFGLVWMLREVEIANFDLDDLEVNTHYKKVTLRWKVSKTDPEAGEVRRTLQCLCHGQSCAWECPFFTTVDLMDKVKKRWGEESKLARTKGGEIPKKNQIVSAWVEVFKRRVTGHSARRSGALHYIREGWDIPQVGYLGRWKSSMILEYAREALETMPANKPLPSRTSSAAPSTKEVEELIKGSREILANQVKAYEENLTKVKAEIEDRMKALGEQCKVEGGNLPKLVQSLAGKVVHENVALIASSPPVTWRTKCGWFYGRSNFHFVNAMEVTCQKCKAAQSNEVEKMQLWNECLGHSWVMVKWIAKTKLWLLWPNQELNHPLEKNECGWVVDTLVEIVVEWKWACGFSCWTISCVLEGGWELSLRPFWLKSDSSKEIWIFHTHPPCWIGILGWGRKDAALKWMFGSQLGHGEMDCQNQAVTFMTQPGTQPPAWKEWMWVGGGYTCGNCPAAKVIDPKLHRSLACSSRPLGSFYGFAEISQLASEGYGNYRQWLYNIIIHIPFARNVWLQ